MLMANPWAPAEPVEVIEGATAPPDWDAYVAQRGRLGFALASRWPAVLERALAHRPYFLHARRGGAICGLLPLALVESRIFGRFLVSLPYLNSAGVLADDEETAVALVDRAISLADRLDVRHLELRHERAVPHTSLSCEITEKVHMRLALPADVDALWSGLKSKVRNQARKGLDDERMTVAWGREELLGEFYDVFCRNMRDLGTPPYPRRLFQEILTAFPDRAELCAVHLEARPVAAALLVHGPDSTEVPSASSLRQFNATCANMRMYWHLLSRAVERGQRVFDFGRSTRDGGTFQFKKQWGARPEPAVWQHYVRRGTARDVRPESRRYRLAIRLWKSLPLAATRWIGPHIVRGIP